MILDSNVYPFQGIQWSFRSFLVKEFHYEAPPQFDVIGTNLNEIKWRYGMSFKIDDSFSLLTFDFDVVASFPDRDTKILMDYIKMREITDISLVGAEIIKDDTTAIRQLVAHCAAMNWLNILSAVTEKTQFTILEGKIKSPLTMPSQFMPGSLEGLHVIAGPSSAEGALRYDNNEYQKALDIVDRAGSSPGTPSMPQITEVQWAIDVIKDRMRGTPASEIVEKARAIVEEKKKWMRVDFQYDFDREAPANVKHNRNYTPIIITIQNGNSNQEIAVLWLEDQEGKKVTLYGYDYQNTYSLEPEEKKQIKEIYYVEYSNKLVRVGVRLRDKWDGPMLWSEFKSAAKEKSLPEMTLRQAKGIMRAVTRVYDLDEPVEYYPEEVIQEAHRVIEENEKRPEGMQYPKAGGLQYPEIK